MRIFIKIGLGVFLTLRILLSVASGQPVAADSIILTVPDAGALHVPMSCRPILALRTNLLLDVIGGPNIGIEVPVGSRYSVAVDFAYAYTRINYRYALQTIQGSLEGRYWFDQYAERLTGWSLGVYTTYCGRFDVQWGGGRQGDGYFSIGVVGGYAIPAWDWVLIDFGIAAGYLYAPEIRRYDAPRDGRLVWNRTTYNASRIALTQVRVNLVWPIFKKQKP